MRVLHASMFRKAKNQISYLVFCRRRFFGCHQILSFRNDKKEIMCVCHPSRQCGLVERAHKGIDAKSVWTRKSDFECHAKKNRWPPNHTEPMPPRIAWIRAQKKEPVNEPIWLSIHLFKANHESWFSSCILVVIFFHGANCYNVIFNIKCVIIHQLFNISYCCLEQSRGSVFKFIYFNNLVPNYRLPFTNILFISFHLFVCFSLFFLQLIRCLDNDRLGQCGRCAYDTHNYAICFDSTVIWTSALSPASASLYRLPLISSSLFLFKYFF